jgi:hypothetical protein
VKRIDVDEQEVRIVYKVAPDHPGQGPLERSLQHCWRGDHPAGARHPCERLDGKGEMGSYLTAEYAVR